MRAIRVLLMAGGAGVAGYGGWLLWPRLPGAWTWLLAGPVLHDLVAAPLVALTGLAAGRLIRHEVRRAWLLGALAVTAVLVLIAVPLVWRPHPAPPNPGLQDRDYVAGLAIWLAALWLGTTLRMIKASFK